MKLKVLPITSWSPTKLSAYENCPLQAQLKYAQSLCPSCFKGRVPYEGVCDKCGVQPVKPPAMARGIKIDNAITAYLLGGKSDEEAVADSLHHPTVLDLIHKAKRDKAVSVQHEIVMQPGWEPVDKFTKGAWLRCKLDVFKLAGKKADVTDWKTGGLDKRTGAIRPNSKYDDQLEIYQLVVLITQPKVEAVSAKLVFLDARPPVDPVLTRPVVTRKQIDKLKAKWEDRVATMFADDTFAPRPGWLCRFCDYGQTKGGRKAPCKY